MKDKVQALCQWGRNNIVPLFVIAVILGAVIKVEAAQYITIGFNDYRVENQKQEYDFSAMEKDAVKRAEEGESAPIAPTGGAACGV